VTIGQICDAAPAADPGPVECMRAQPPRGAGVARTVRVGDATPLIDLQPCGGTHVARTGEIGALAVTRIEKKGAMARRVVLGIV
jgi:misacylated tRNA(Ala) deacylase